MNLNNLEKFIVTMFVAFMLSILFVGFYRNGYRQGALDTIKACNRLHEVTR